jgi:hypothetical protein
MTLENDPARPREATGAATLRPLLWLIIAAVVAMTTLMFAPVPPL